MSPFANSALLLVSSHFSFWPMSNKNKDGAHFVAVAVEELWLARAGGQQKGPPGKIPLGVVNLRVHSPSWA